MDTRAEAEAYLTKADIVLGKLIQSQTLITRPVRKNYYESLCRAIIGQQVSVQAAAAIFGRFENASSLDPANYLQLDLEAKRAIGLSRQKISYLDDLSSHFVDNPTIYQHLGELSDEAVITDLTAIKGIGRWTAQMFLMFTLQRPDVFAPDDVGLQRAMLQLYGWTELPKPKALEAVAENWRPYRTTASLHLWQSLHNTPN